MSPPEVWGPAVWILFHTLIDKMNPDVYPYVIRSMFGAIVRICRFLPCPDCSRDASNFLAKINLKDYKTKDEFKNMMYLFHNWVNAKKRKPLFNYAKINMYANLHLPFVINNFIAKYNTKGNMKLLAESFQRSLVVKDFINWFTYHSKAFITAPIVKNNSQPLLEPIQEETIIKDNTAEQLITIQEEPVIKEPIVDEPIVDEPIVDEPIVDEPIAEEEAEETVIQVEEPIIQVEEEPIIQVEEEPIIQVEEEPIIQVEEHTSYIEESNTVAIPLDEKIQEHVTIEETIVQKKKRNKSKK
jgi:hypothetical protein